MSTKKLQIIDENTGEIIEEAKFTGGYHVIYTNIDDMGRLKHIRELDNAKFGDRHWIKNFVYRPIAKKLIEKFDELTPINPLRILFLQDMEYEKPSGGKNQWEAKISKANKQFSAMTGYDYILETRNYFIERMNREQMIALIYHELRHIDRSRELQPQDIEDWSNMVATLGKDWATTKVEIKNLIDDDIIWKKLEQAGKQLDMFNLKLAK